MDRHIFQSFLQAVSENWSDCGDVQGDQGFSSAYVSYSLVVVY